MASDVEIPQVGRLWHWSYADQGDRRNFVYTAKNNLFVHQQLIGTGRTKVTERADAMLAEMNLLFTGEDEKVIEIAKRANFPVTAIAYRDIERVELLPYVGQSHVRIRYRVGDKQKKVTLKGGGEMDMNKVYDELRETISPASALEQEEMGLLLAIRGPIGFVLVIAMLGWMLWYAGEYGYEGVQGLGVLFEKIGRAVGPTVILVITAVLIAFPLKIIIDRIRKRPTVTVWRYRTAS